MSLAKALYPIPAFSDPGLREPTLLHAMQCDFGKEGKRGRISRCSCHTGTSLVIGNVQVMGASNGAVQVRPLPREGEAELATVWVEGRGLAKIERGETERILKKGTTKVPPVQRQGADWQTFEKFWPWIDKEKILTRREPPRAGHLVAPVKELESGELIPLRWLCEIERTPRKSKAVLVEPALRPGQALRCTFIQRSVRKFDPQRPERVLVAIYPIPLSSDGIARAGTEEINEEGMIIEPPWL